MSKEQSKLFIIDARMINNSGIGVYIEKLVLKLCDFYNILLIGDKYSINKKFKEVDVLHFFAKPYSIKEQLLPLIIPKCDLYWSPHINIPFFKIRAKKIVTTIHDVNHLAFDNNFSYLKKKYAKIIYKNAVKKSDHLITVSNFSKSEIIRELKIDEKLISVIYNGVSGEFFKNQKSNKKNTKEYFLFVGNVKPHKNVTLLLNAYNKLPESIKNNYQLIILGQKDGFLTKDKSVLNFINTKEQKNIKFTGFVKQNEIYGFYKNSSLLIFPTLYEGFGLPLIEGMSSKTKVLCSNIPSLKEIGKDFVNYFNPKNEKELQLKIIEVLKDESLQNKKIEKAFERAKEFTWEKSLKKHINIFNELLKE